MVGFLVGRESSQSLNPFAALLTGGEGGIRTHGAVTRTPDFESGTFDHSATSPRPCILAQSGSPPDIGFGITLLGKVTLRRFHLR